ncbi:MAG: hypothetical protein JWN44_2118 [Myxococcales bacterium]|nr:hypothetical protein [Myxococcales bacterium]
MSIYRQTAEKVAYGCATDGLITFNCVNLFVDEGAVLTGSTNPGATNW